MPHIVAAGLPPELPSWLQQRLGVVSVQVTHSCEQTLDELNAGSWEVLILDGSVINGTVAKLLEDAYSSLRQGERSVVYCLEKNLSCNLPRKLVGQILFHPLDWEELAGVVAEILNLALPPSSDLGLISNGENQEISLPNEQINNVQSPIELSVAESQDLRLGSKEENKKLWIPDEQTNNLQSEIPTPQSQIETSLQAEIAGLWETFKDKILLRVAVLEKAAQAILAGDLNDELLNGAVDEAHKLAGSLGTFGFFQGCCLARDIEQLLRLKVTPGQAQGGRLAELVAALYLELEDTPAIEASEESGDRSPTRVGNKQPRLLIVEDDTELAQRLVMEAVSWGMHADSVYNLSTAREIIPNAQPHLVLLDLIVSDATEERLKLLKELSSQTPPVPVIVLAYRDTLINQVEVAKLGGCAFLQKPVSPAQVMEAVTQVLKHDPTEQFNLVVVDDDPQILATIKILLQPWGLNLTTLDDPRRLWHTLEAATPDLLVLDVDMPHANGIELCQVIRNDPKWSSLPVLFLSSHTDPATVQRVFHVGADDFVNKPIAGPELVTRIFNRLERIRVLRSIAETDLLTGVSNRRKSTGDLERCLSMSKRHGHPLCFAILDLDRFKQINDQYGHAAGDRVLQRLGKLLLKSFRSHDVVARWGGEEFVVGLYSITKAAAVKRLSQVLAKLREEEFVYTDGKKFYVSFSAGVVQYLEDGDDLQSLYKRADEVLYQAKAAGRNRVLGAE